MDYFSAEYLTSPETRDDVLEKLNRVPVVKYSAKVGRRKAAVMVLLCVHRNGKVSILYTLRSSNLKSHAGQVSFPGGKADPEDKSVIDTALRETEEELGIPRDAIEVWGRSRFFLPSYTFDMRVLPVIGVIRNFDDLRMKPNRAEVEDVFCVPIERLCDRQYFGFTEFRGGFVFPVFMGGKHKIWGLTATFTHLLLSCMMPEELYPMHFQYLSMPERSSKL